MLKMVSNETDIDSNKIEFDITFRMRFCGNYFMWASSDRYLWLCKLARSARMLCCVGSSGIIHPVEQQVQHCNIGSSLPTLATQSTSTTANTQPQDAQHTPDEEGQWEECQKCHEEGKCAENFQNRWQIPRQPRADCKYFHITSKDHWDHMWICKMCNFLFFSRHFLSSWSSALQYSRSSSPSGWRAHRQT